MDIHETTTPTLAAAMHILADSIESEDGIANAAILEAANRLTELHGAIEKTILDNLHLADGEICTLIDIKKVYNPNIDDPNRVVVFGKMG